MTVPRDENWLTGLSDFPLAACEHAFPPFLVLHVWPTVTDFPTAPKAIKSTSDWSVMEISFFMIRMFDLAKMLHHMPFMMQRSPPARGVPCLSHFYGNVPITHSIVVSSNTPVTGMP